LSDLLDINIWIAFTFENHEHHSVAEKYFDNVPEQGAAFCRVTELGFLRLSTNKKVALAQTLTLVEAWAAYDELRRDGRVVYLEEPTDLEAEWRRLTQIEKPARNTWTDAYLAAFAIAAGLRFITLDKDFSTFTGLDCKILSI
jgi:toxin-antitoxin system PIN domain toxin